MLRLSMPKPPSHNLKTSTARNNAISIRELHRRSNTREISTCVRISSRTSTSLSKGTVFSILKASNSIYGSRIRYVRERRGRRLQECNEKIAESESDIASLNVKLEEVRHNVEAIKSEIAESGAFVANLRENIRAQRLKREIAEMQAEIDSYDMDEIAKARRLFNEQWNVEKQKETALQSKVRTLCDLHSIDH